MIHTYILILQSSSSTFPHCLLTHVYLFRPNVCLHEIILTHVYLLQLHSSCKHTDTPFYFSLSRYFSLPLPPIAKLKKQTPFLFLSRVLSLSLSLLLSLSTIHLHFQPQINTTTSNSNNPTHNQT
jgi:hypothetical protein